MSLPVELAQYTHAHSWIICAVIAGLRKFCAPVSPVAVPALPCAKVHSSTFPATVVLAFAVTVP